MPPARSSSKSARLQFEYSSPSMTMRLAWKVAALVMAERTIGRSATSLKQAGFRGEGIRRRLRGHEGEDSMTQANPTAAELGIMAGFPPALDKRVRFANWGFPPLTRSSIQNVRARLPT